MTKDEAIRKVFKKIQTQYNTANTYVRDYENKNLYHVPDKTSKAYAAYQRWRGRRDACQNLLGEISGYALALGCEIEEIENDGRRIKWEEEK